MSSFFSFRKSATRSSGLVSLSNSVADQGGGERVIVPKVIGAHGGTVPRLTKKGRESQSLESVFEDGHGGTAGRESSDV